MARALRTQVDVVLPDGVAVLNAEDERIAAMAELCDGEVILYGLDAALPAVAAHRAAGGRAAFVRDGHLMLATGADEHDIGLLRAPAAASAAAPLAVLAGVCAAWGLGLAPELISTGLHTFAPMAPDAAGALMTPLAN